MFLKMTCVAWYILSVQPRGKCEWWKKLPRGVQVMYLKQGKIDYSTRFSATEMTLSYPTTECPLCHALGKTLRSPPFVECIM